MKALCYILAVVFAAVGILFVLRVFELHSAEEKVPPVMYLFMLLFPVFAVRNWLRARRMGREE